MGEANNSSALPTEAADRTSDRMRPKKKDTNQLGKRDAAFVQSRGDRIQGQSEVLFERSASTASIVKVLRSTTKKPEVIRTSATSTRRPAPARVPRPTVRYKVIKGTPTTTTKKPVRNNLKLAKMIQRPSEPARTRDVTAARMSNSSSSSTQTPEATTGTSATMRLVEPISSRKMSTLQAISSSSSVQYEPKSTPAPTSTQSPAAARSPTQAQQSQLPQQTTLTRATQTLTTLPVNQRRPPVNVVQSRPFSSSSARPGGLASGVDKFAGENWALFQRSDGRFSAFEMLALMSNILIVSTLLVVILFNWIKLFKRRQRARQASQRGPSASSSGREQQQQQQRSLQEAPSVQHDERVSQISSGLSAFTSTTANETVTTLTANTHSNESRAIRAAAHTAGGPVGQLGAQLQSRSENLIGQLEQANNSNAASSVFNKVSNGANVANKAMAIVQPRENTSGMAPKANNLLDGGGSEKLRAFKEELDKQSRAISRSVSDLSGGAGSGKEKIETAPVRAQLRKSTDDLNTTKRSPTSTPDRVSALEELFKDTGAKANKFRNSSGSLSSIELPASLVEPVKRQASALAANTMGPSPNLLLGELEVPSVASGKPQASETEPGPSSKPETSQQAKEDQAMIGAGAGSAPGKSPEQSAEARPENPMSREMRRAEEAGVGTAASGSKPETGAGTGAETGEKGKKGAGKGRNEARAARKEPAKKQPDSKASAPDSQSQSQSQSQPSKPTSEVKNHQVVVNKLDKRKTKLEIVDLRDESVTGNMRHKEEGGGKTPDGAGASWISMDGVAVVQPAGPGGPVPQSSAASAPTTSGPAQAAPLSPSEIIESRFHVDYKSKRKQAGPKSDRTKQSDSMDSKQEEYVFNNIDNELEQDNRMRNRKYFVYIVHDGHFTAKKECIARIELPQRRRITLAELRQLIANSQDISLSSLRRNRFKFVTETYRLLNENEDAAVLHQVYPTQGVFLKLNVAENENQTYAFKGARNTRLSSGSGGQLAGTSLSQATIASRRRANARPDGRKLNSTGGQEGTLPAIDVTYADQTGPRASSVGRRRAAAHPAAGTAYRRSKSSVQTGRGAANSGQANDHSTLPSLGMSKKQAHYLTDRPYQAQHREYVAAKRPAAQLPAHSKKATGSNKSLLESAASDLSANVLSGAKKLFTAVF